MPSFMQFIIAIPVALIPAAAPSQVFCSAKVLPCEPPGVRSAGTDFAARYSYERRLTNLGRERSPKEVRVVHGVWEVIREGSHVRLSLDEYFGSSGSIGGFREQQDWFFEDGVLVGFVSDGNVALPPEHLPGGAPHPPFLAPLDTDFGLVFGSGLRILAPAQAIVEASTEVDVVRTPEGEVEYRHPTPVPSEIGDMRYTVIHRQEAGGIGIEHQHALWRVNLHHGTAIELPIEYVDATRGPDGFAETITVRQYAPFKASGADAAADADRLARAAANPDSHLLERTLELELVQLCAPDARYHSARYEDVVPRISSVYLDGMTAEATCVLSDEFDPDSPPALVYNAATRGWDRVAAHLD